MREQETPQRRVLQRFLELIVIEQQLIIEQQIIVDLQLQLIARARGRGVPVKRRRGARTNG